MRKFLKRFIDILLYAILFLAFNIFFRVIIFGEELQLLDRAVDAFIVTAMYFAIMYFVSRRKKKKESQSESESE